MHDIPDAEEAAPLAGTDLMWIGRADGIQIRVEGQRPDGLALVLLDPKARPSDRLVTEISSRPTTERAEEDRVPRPKLITRPKWGADESLRDGRPTYNHTIKQVHVHHTVNSNNYDRDDVPALIRGMYAYHTQSLGWSDIGYNFLVDRFGRAFVGRAGGPAKLVRGAHTLGFNAQSTGISAIGNYDAARPTKPMLETIAAIAAWRLDPFERNPRGHIRVTSEGSDKFAARRRVKLPVIDGHRDTNDTACPGRHLYGALPGIRRRAARLIDSTRQTMIVIEAPATIVGVSTSKEAPAAAGAPLVVRLGDRLRVDPGTFRPADATVTYRWRRGARPIRGARDQAYQVRPWDVGHELSCRVTLTRDGLAPTVQTTPSVGPATAEPAIALTTSSRNRSVRVTAIFAAPADVRPSPTGEVTVRVGDRSKTVKIDNGRADARFGVHRRMRPGSYPVTVDYAGDIAFAASTGQTRVEIT
ncbi:MULTISPECIES: N-acetylmuramoyl-L-alanine amidase [unclassified Nocardioides]|uniref:N-acetylmuramoyl-L-alanine amidase n=1 Tax=unclassified Nocardioides TaxID=2615069 RepID=UPI0013FDA2B2|nr:MULTISPECIES: N-acetylmuramoyl-L-alanine amidase [unclassified Nocardioides]